MACLLGVAVAVAVGWEGHTLKLEHTLEMLDC